MLTSLKSLRLRKLHTFGLRKLPIFGLVTFGFNFGCQLIGAACEAKNLKYLITPFHESNLNSFVTPRIVTIFTKFITLNGLENFI